MKQLNVRLPEELHEKLKVAAERDRRSLNAMIIVMIERGLAEGDRRP